jgi:hypothetical protein
MRLKPRFRRSSALQRSAKSGDRTSSVVQWDLSQEKALSRPSASTLVSSVSGLLVFDYHDPGRLCFGARVRQPTCRLSTRPRKARPFRAQVEAETERKEAGFAEGFWAPKMGPLGPDLGPNYRNRTHLQSTKP